MNNKILADLLKQKGHATPDLIHAFQDATSNTFDCTATWFNPFKQVEAVTAVRSGKPVVLHLEATA